MLSSLRKLMLVAIASCAPSSAFAQCKELQQIADAHVAGVFKTLDRGDGSGRVTLPEFETCDVYGGRYLCSVFLSESTSAKNRAAATDLDRRTFALLTQCLGARVVATKKDGAYEFERAVLTRYPTLRIHTEFQEALEGAWRLKYDFVTKEAEYDFEQAGGN